MTTTATFNIVQKENVLHTETSTFTNLRTRNGTINIKNESKMLKRIREIKDELSEKYPVGNFDIKLNVEFKTVEDV